MTQELSRRGFMTTGAAAALGVAGTSCATVSGQGARKTPHKWPICLNTSTIRPASLEDKIRIASETGYDGIELWVGELEEWERQGGDLRELGARLHELGLMVPNVIGLWNVMPADEEAWRASLPATRERMRLAAAVGSQHVAAIPAPDRPDFDLARGAAMYRELLTIGREEYGVTVAFEFIGFLEGVHRLGQACAVAIDADDRDACLVADTFHLYRGGSGFNGVRHLRGDFIAVFHWNDVPETPAREEMRDEHRILPGDGALPLAGLLRDLDAIGYTGPLSVELFNRALWEQDPKEVARIALEKTRALVAEAAAPMAQP